MKLPHLVKNYFLLIILFIFTSDRFAFANSPNGGDCKAVLASIFGDHELIREFAKLDLKLSQELARPRELKAKIAEAQTLKMNTILELSEAEKEAGFLDLFLFGIFGDQSVRENILNLQDQLRELDATILAEKKDLDSLSTETDLYSFNVSMKRGKLILWLKANDPTFQAGESLKSYLINLISSLSVANRVLVSTSTSTSIKDQAYPHIVKNDFSNLQQIIRLVDVFTEISKIEILPAKPKAILAQEFKFEGDVTTYAEQYQNWTNSVLEILRQLRDNLEHSLEDRASVVSKHVHKLIKK